MRIPESIQSYLHEKTGHTDDIGMSGSYIVVYDDCVLKVEDVTPYTETSVAAMDWLWHHIPSPRVLIHEIAEGKSYLLMSRTPGKMSCSPEYLDQAALLVSALAEGLHLLWSADYTDCLLSAVLSDRRHIINAV